MSYLALVPSEHSSGQKTKRASITQAEATRIIVKDKKGKEKDKGWTCELVPKALIVARYFAKEQEIIDQLATDLETVAASLTELEEEHGGEDGAFSELEKVNKGNITARLKEIKGNKEAKDEAGVLNKWLKLNKEEAAKKQAIKAAELDLDAKAYAHYPKLTEDEIKKLVVDDKWHVAIEAAISGEIDRISQVLTQRVKLLAERYDTPMPQLTDRVSELEGILSERLHRKDKAEKLIDRVTKIREYNEHSFKNAL